jgi:zinc protease
MQLKPYEDKFVEAPLVKQIINSAEITSKSENKDLEYKEYILSNGARVIIKPTNFKNDEIQFSAFSLGGTSLCPTEDILNAMYASSIVEECGLAQFSKSDLKKKLAGKDIDITPYIQETKQGFSGKFAPKDMETFLQLIYLYFTDIRNDEEAFNSFISKLKSQFKFIMNNPQFVFIEKFTKMITQNNPRIILIPTEEQLKTVTLEKSLNFFKQRFSNANGFTFIFVGNINEQEALPLIQKYIGGLPSTNNKDMWKDVLPEFPSGIVTDVVYKGMEEKGMVAMAWNTNHDWSQENNIKLQEMIKILEIMLRENVREKESGTYGVQVRAQVEKYPKSYATITIIFGCDPKRQDKLSSVVFKQISILKKKGPSNENLNKVKEQLIRERETDIKRNNWWARKLENLYYYDDPKTSLDMFNILVNKVTPKDIQDFANKYFSDTRYVKLYLKPEKTK